MPPADFVNGLGRGPRAFVLLLGVALVVHSALVALWLAPSSPLRDAVGGQRLASYVDPYFQQGDDTAGIGSNRVDESLQLSALVRTGESEPTTTEWFDVTDDGLARAHQAARRLAVSLNAALFGLSGGQRALLAKVTADQSTADVVTTLRPAGPDQPVIDFVTVDQMARQYASLWLGARLPDVEVLEVRYRVGRRDAPEAGESAERLDSRPFTWFDTGWRKPFRGTPEARAAFDDYVGATGG